MRGATPARSSVVGPLVVIALVLATMAFGFMHKQGQSHLSTDLPIRVFAPTHATARLADFGYGDQALRGLRDANHVPLERTGIAMWCKVAIPRGLDNHPSVSFELRDPAGSAFPYQVAWTRDGAYLFLPTGYPGAPARLTVAVRQGDRLVDRLQLPKLPKPLPAPTPTLTPVPGRLRIVRVQNPNAPRNIVSLLVSGRAADNADTLIAEPVGSSSSVNEPCNGYRFQIAAKPEMVDMHLNFPASTHRLYLSVTELRLEPSQSPRGLPDLTATHMIQKIIRTGITSVSLDHVERLAPGEARPATVMIQTAGGARGNPFSIIQGNPMTTGPSSALPPLAPIPQAP